MFVPKGRSRSATIANLLPNATSGPSRDHPKTSQTKIFEQKIWRKKVQRVSTECRPTLDFAFGNKIAKIDTACAKSMGNLYLRSPHSNKLLRGPQKNKKSLSPKNLLYYFGFLISQSSNDYLSDAAC